MNLEKMKNKQLAKKKIILASEKANEANGKRQMLAMLRELEETAGEKPET